ncbi:zinc finger protein 664-like [Sabethes cyaneus]|uniref:zinc finger protein 664-like n=1 Tax=Sabethes cyaneus TaxID=53552 RepID=UPI00237E5B6E|nr:zinc finger protein 664-like [Sabethes cyaneus]
MHWRHSTRSVAGYMISVRHQQSAPVGVRVKMSAAAAAGAAEFASSAARDGDDEDVTALLANCDRDSAVWKEILVDNDLFDCSLENDDHQFVDFVRCQGDSVLDLIIGTEEGTPIAAEEIDGFSEDNCGKRKADSLCNGVENLLAASDASCNSDVLPMEGLDRIVRCMSETIGDDAFKCGVCLLRFKIKAHLIRHMLLKHRQETVHKSEKIYGRCRRCNEFFNTTAELEVHLRKAHRTTLFCDICLRLFNNKDQLKRHRRFHSGANPFACDVCNKQCQNSSHLHFHRRSHFVTNLGYRCPHCDKLFSSAGNCQKHVIRIHTREKRYKCLKCGEAFVYTRQLKIHERESHGFDAKFGPNGCQSCRLPFRTSEELQKHQKEFHYQKDRPHACDQCPSRFKQLGHLKTHKLTHSGSKPFACDLCDKRFLIGHDLKLHKQTKHSQERPFRCDQCERGFVAGYLLKQHQLKTHGVYGGSTKG